MKPVFTFDELRETEKNIIEKENIPSLILMENAGKNSFDKISQVFPNLNEYEINIFCGKGNNAGDGFTLARHFCINSIPCTLYLVVEPSYLKGDALINYELLKNFSTRGSDSLVRFAHINSIIKSNKKFDSNKSIIIDAILGTGIKGKLDDNFNDAINFLNGIRSKKTKIISLDVPSGLMSGEQINPVVNADYTITMGAYKAELLFDAGKENCGGVSVVPIGIDDGLIEKYNSPGKYYIESSDVKNLLPKRKKTSHKYKNGKVLVIGGSRGLSGAVIMSALSAVKSGAGGVAAGIPKSISTHFSRKLYEVMKVELDETGEGSISCDQFSRLNKRMDWADVVLLGPGISTNEQTKKFVFEVIENCPKDMVIDADALNLISSDLSILKRRKHNNQIILTPHLGEFSRLLNVDIEELLLNRFEHVRQFVRKYEISLVLKSETSLSCLNELDLRGAEQSPRRRGNNPIESTLDLRGAERRSNLIHRNDSSIFINSTGNESLASAGSGDVLSGIIASLFSQTGDPYRAMICGNYLHGLCADLYYAKCKNKQTCSPQDIIKFIPEAVSYILN